MILSVLTNLDIVQQMIAKHIQCLWLNDSIVFWEKKAKVCNLVGHYAYWYFLLQLCFLFLQSVTLKVQNACGEGKQRLLQYTVFTMAFEVSHSSLCGYSVNH